MLISKKWLNQYIPNFIETDYLKTILNNLGFEVEKIKYLGKNIKSVFTGKILQLQKHPNSKKMLICKVKLKKEILNIVTTDKNVYKGMIVPVAKINSIVLNKIIKIMNLKGINSYGMLCSGKDLGFENNVLSELEKNTVYSFPKNTLIGEDVKKILYLDDVIFDISVPPNRSDCYGIYNLAKEISIFIKSKNKNLINLETIKMFNKKNDLVDIIINEKKLCHRYCFKIIKNINLEESPLWLQNLLRNINIRPINNLIDITNYVMFELGHPMHVFDLDSIDCSNNKKKLYVKFAFEDEHFITLDNVSRKLNKNMLVISDKKKSLSLAGIMGGLNSEIKNNTRNILLEVAHFDSYNIRQTSKKLGLISESSIRFGKGISENNIKLAIERACYLIKLLNIGEVNNVFVDNYKTKQIIREINISSKDIKNILGINLTKKNITLILKKLKFENHIDKNNNNIKIFPPAHRVDIKEKIDLIEEILRVFGYNNIPETLPNSSFNFLKTSKNIILIEKIKNLMVSYGFDEIINYSFINKKYSNKINLEKNNKKYENIMIKNPLNEKQSLMRFNLLPGMLETAEFNYKRKQRDFKFFEIGRVFNKIKKSNINEFLKLGVLFLEKEEKNWYGKEKFDFFYLKGVLERLLYDLFLFDISFKELKDNNNFHPGKSAIILFKKQQIGIIGAIHPNLISNYDIDGTIYYFELNLENIKNDKTYKFKEIPKYPCVERDLSILIPNYIKYEQIQNVIETNMKFCNILSYKLYDIYVSDKFKKDFKSITFKIIYQNFKKTLTDIEVNKYHLKLLNKLKTNLNIQLR